MVSLSRSTFFRLALTPTFLMIILASCDSENSQADAVEKFLNEAYSNGQFNGNILVAVNGEVIYHESFGVADIGPGSDLTLESQFRLASVSKTMTAMAVMILKERGLLDYDQSIQSYLPELPYDVTVRHLLTHTSGIPDYTYLFEEFWDLEHNLFEEKQYADNDAVIKMFVDHHPDLRFAPGDRYSYSNTGYVFLASIVQRASGVPFHKFLDENIFQPLKMSNTLVYSAIRNDPMNNRVIGYRLAMNGTDRIPNDFHYMSGIGGDGAVYSTTGDLFKWDRALYTDRLVSKESLDEAFTPFTLNDGSKTRYGLGWGIDHTAAGRTAVNHGGGWIAARTWLYREIDDDNSVILLTNHTSRDIYSIESGLKQILNGDSPDPLLIGIADLLGPILEAKGVEAAIDEYHAVKISQTSRYNFSLWEINYLANRLMDDGRYDEAITLFRLNVDQFPESDRVYSELGEALRLNGETEEAIEQFRKCLALSPNNGYAQEKLNLLTLSN